MYKKIFIYSRKEISEILLLIEEEGKKCLKFEVNYLQRNSLRSKYYFNKEKLIEKIKELEENKFILTFFYLKTQKKTMRNDWKDKTAEEFLEDLTSIFDKRKINKCFNYILDKKEEEEIAKKIANEIYSKCEIKNEVEKCLKKVMEIDRKLYNEEQIEIPEDFMKNLILETGKYKEIEELCECLKKKYELIKKYDYSNLEVSLPKEIRGLEKILQEKELEEFVLDESYSRLFENKETELKIYLKETFGKSLTKDKVKTFSKYVEANDLKKIILAKYDKVKKNINEKISNLAWKKIKKVLSLDLMEELIFEDVNNIYRYRIKLLQIFKIISSKDKESELCIELKKEIIKEYYKKIFNEILLLCKVEIKKKEIKKLQIKDEKDKKKLKEGLRKNLKVIEDIIPENNDLEDKIEKIESTSVYKIFLKREEEILNILYDIETKEKNSIKKIEKIFKEIEDEIMDYIEKEDTLKLDLEKILKITFDFSVIIQEIVDQYLDYEEVRIKREIMERYLNTSI
ncbi:hypothetical protein [Fusobacterium varium]